MLDRSCRRDARAPSTNPLIENGLFLPEGPIRTRLPRAAFAGAIALGLALFTPWPGRSTPMPPFELPEVAIQPLGDVDPALIETVAEHVADVFAVAVVVVPARALPEQAFYPPRHRYRGERILADLEACTEPAFVKVVGVMSRDLSVTSGAIPDWGVLGVAQRSSRVAVVSTHRLGGHADRARLEERLTRVTIHELGHACGLDHCPVAGCVMNDANGSIHTVDRSTGEFCAACAERLAGWLNEPEQVIAVAGSR
jgi:archaemetzincin